MDESLQAEIQQRLRPYVTKGTISMPVICGNTLAAQVAHNLLRFAASFLVVPDHEMGSDPA
jgi:hypothetical protein